MTVSIAQAKSVSGDLIFHVGGCKDLTNPRHTRTYEGVTLHSGYDTLLDAILAADVSMADWFGQEPYEDGDSETWSVAKCEWAPCFLRAMKVAKIRFGHNGRPF